MAHSLEARSNGPLVAVLSKHGKIYRAEPLFGDQTEIFVGHKSPCTGRARASWWCSGPTAAGAAK